jgi:hypothetical protein
VEEIGWAAGGLSGLDWMSVRGLSGRLTLMYNPILYASGVCRVLAIMRENRSSSRLVGLL